MALLYGCHDAAPVAARSLGPVLRSKDWDRWSGVRVAGLGRKVRLSASPSLAVAPAALPATAFAAALAGTFAGVYLGPAAPAAGTRKNAVLKAQASAALAVLGVARTFWSFRWAFSSAAHAGRAAMPKSAELFVENWRRGVRGAWRAVAASRVDAA